MAELTGEGVGGCPLVLQPLGPAAPVQYTPGGRPGHCQKAGAEAPFGLLQPLWHPSGSQALIPHPPGDTRVWRSPLGLLPSAPTESQTQTVHPDLGRTGELDVERVLKWQQQQQHGAGLDVLVPAPSGDGSSTVKRISHHGQVPACPHRPDPGPGLHLWENGDTGTWD